MYKKPCTWETTSVTSSPFSKPYLNTMQVLSTSSMTAVT